MGKNNEKLTSLDGLYYDLENGTIYTTEMLQVEFMELITDEMKKYGTVCTMSFCDYLNDATSKNGSLYTMRDWLGCMIDDIKCHGWDTDEISNFLEFVKQIQEYVEYWVISEFINAEFADWH